MRINYKIIGAQFFTISLLGIASIFLDADRLYVCTSILLCLWIFSTLFLYLWQIDGRPPIIDIGILCALSTTIYAVYPIVNYWVGGLEFGVLSDGRLSRFNITPQELFDFELNNIIYLFSFCFIYAWLRKPGRLLSSNYQTVPTPFFKNTILVLIPLYLFVIAISIYYQTSFLNPSYVADTYDGYTSTMNSLPLFLRQLINKALPLITLSKLALLFFLVSRLKNRYIYIVLISWFIIELVVIIVNKGGRSGFIFFVISILLYYHFLIKEIDLKYYIFMSIIGLFCFNLLGFYRTGLNFNESVDFSSFLVFNFSVGNEFQSMLGTAYDVYLRKLSGVDIPTYLYFNDFMAVLPPQQLLPFEKISASEWYLRELGISGTGQGYMWGVVTQSIIGGGWLELALRGLILAFILAKYHNFFIRHQRNYLVTFFYIYLCVRIYYTYRDTTFAFLPILLWEVLPFYLFLKLCGLPNSKNNLLGSRY